MGDFGVLSPDGMSLSHPSHQGSGTDVEEEEGLQKPKVVDDFKETAVSEHNVTDTHMNS